MDYGDAELRKEGREGSKVGLVTDMWGLELRGSTTDHSVFAIEYSTALLRSPSRTTDHFASVDT